MKHIKQKPRPEPPPLVPRSMVGWLSALAKALLTVVVLAIVCASHTALRHGQQMSGALGR